ncbi:MAG: hypothetical protein P9L99_20730 [Candidatus Lernaella stagnicola]|nr:hypothetical protein [Candidatus Lernaella stagnicola]
MNSIEMMKCLLSNDESAGDGGNVRYIPVDIFDMWRFLMERVHGLQVNDALISMWVPEEEFDTAEHGEKKDAVVEVQFRYMDIGEVGRTVTRYFPEDDFDGIFGTFRRHFPDDDRMKELKRRRGFFLAGAIARSLDLT